MKKACFKWQIFFYFFIFLILLALAVKVATAVKKLLSRRRSKSKWPFLISRWSISVCFFQKCVWLINVRLWTDGRGQSSTKQKMIQGILHSSYKQMFCTVVTSTDLLRHIIIRCQLFWLWLPSWISDGLVCRGPSCLPVISTETEEVVSPTACAHISHLLSFMLHHSCRLLHSTILHMKPSKLNKHDQVSNLSLFRALKVFTWPKYNSVGSSLAKYDIINWIVNASQCIFNSNFNGLDIL